MFTSRKNKHKNMHALKRGHCIAFLVFTFKKKTLHCPSRKSTSLVECRNMSSIKSGCKKLKPVVSGFYTNPSKIKSNFISKINACKTVLDLSKT